MTETPVLYDLASRDNPNKCWSYNVWKVRLVLNYKKIAYTTSWVDHDNLQPTIKSLGVKPNTSSKMFEYTVPTVKFPDGLVVTDSAVIAERLQTLHPNPPISLNTELQAEADRAIHLLFMPLVTTYMSCLAHNIISEPVLPAWTASREKLFGFSFEEAEKTKDVQKSWEAARPGFDVMKALITEHKQDDGPFILGSRVSYADFIILAGFEAFKRAGDGMFEKAMAMDPKFGEIYAAAKDWFSKDE